MESAIGEKSKKERAIGNVIKRRDKREESRGKEGRGDN